MIEAHSCIVMNKTLKYVALSKLYSIHSNGAGRFDPGVFVNCTTDDMI